MVENIINLGYSGAEFANYMASKKENGTDIDNWKIQELRYLVEEFKMFNKPTTHEDEEKKEVEEDEEEEKEAGSPTQRYAGKSNELNPLDAQVDAQVQAQRSGDVRRRMTMAPLPQKTVRATVVPTGIVEKGVLGKFDNLRIRVTEPLLKESGTFLSSSYLTFKVNTDPCKWANRRKDKEFNSLHDYLVKLYPNILVPAIPQFKTKNKYESKFLRKR